MLPYTWSLSAGTLPPFFSLSTGGAIYYTGQPSGAGSFNITVKATDSSTPPQTATQNLTITILGITPSPLPAGIAGVAYSQTFAFTGGTPPLQWGVASGAVPSGLALGAATGILAGTPSAPGTFNFTLVVATGSPSPHLLAEQSFQVAVRTAQTISFSPSVTSFPVSAGSFVVSATASSNLSVALVSMTGTVCTISGATVTILSAGTCAIQASQAGNASYAAATPVLVNFTIIAPLSITSVTLPPGMTGSAYSGSAVQWQGGVPPYSFAALNLPAGLTASGVTSSTTGTIGGTPSGSAGSYSLSLQVTDAENPPQSTSRSASLAINPAFTIGSSSWAATQAGGTSPAVSVTAPSLAWNVSLPSQPSWLTVSTSGQTGSGSFTLSAAPNTNVAPRSATAIVSGGGSSAMVVVTQSGVTISVLPTSAQFLQGGSTQPLTVTVSASGAAWTASPSNSWITVSNVATGSFQLSVAADAAATRSGTVNILSEGVVMATLAVFQDPPAAGSGGVVVPNTTLKEYIRAGSRIVAIDITPPTGETAPGGNPNPGQAAYAQLNISNTAFTAGDSFTLWLNTNLPAGSSIEFCWNNGWGCISNYAVTGSSGSWSLASTFPTGLAASWQEWVIVTSPDGQTSVTSNTIAFTVNPGGTDSNPTPYMNEFISGTLFQGAVSGSMWVESNLPNTTFLICFTFNGTTQCLTTQTTDGNGYWSSSFTFASGAQSYDGTFVEWVIQQCPPGQACAGAVSNKIYWVISP